MTKPNILKIYAFALICMTAVLSAGELSARTPIRIDTIKTVLQVKRPALEPVHSLMKSPTDPIDTLDTVNEHVKVIIYGDNTWKYYKTPEFQQVTGVFDECWSATGTNPYGIEQSDLPVSWSIWLVDSLDQYHCPYQGEVYHRGKFGVRRGRRHQGVDIPLKTGDPVYATFTGKVRISKYWGSFGNLVVIRHENGIETFYGHLSEIMVKPNEWVTAGQQIGKGGNTGRSTGSHLHYEMRYKGQTFDPSRLIDFETGTLRRETFLLKRTYFSPYSRFTQDFDEEVQSDEEDKKIAAEAAAIKYHIVKRGDTLGRIAINNHTTVTKLCQLNGIKKTAVLRIGQRIRVR